jgi:hypothetical protein
MHELGVTESIVNIALTKAEEVKASRILQISIVIGELSGFVPDCIEFYFESLRKDTIAEISILFQLNSAAVIVQPYRPPKVCYGYAPIARVIAWKLLEDKNFILKIWS